MNGTAADGFVTSCIAIDGTVTEGPVEPDCPDACIYHSESITIRLVGNNTRTTENICWICCKIVNEKL